MMNSVVIDLGDDGEVGLVGGPDGDWGHDGEIIMGVEIGFALAKQKPRPRGRGSCR
jgi:hypothetical protein